MTHPTNAEIEAALNRTTDTEIWIGEANMQDLETFRDCTIELLALRTGRHESHWMAPNEPTFDMWNEAENISMMAEFTYEQNKLSKEQSDDLNKYPTYRIWHLVTVYKAMRSAAIEGEKDA